MKKSLKDRAREMKGQLTAVYYASRDRRIGLLPKVVIAMALLYALSPLDLIPDFIPVLGYLDDLLIIPVLIALAIRMIPTTVWKEAQEAAERNPISLKKNWTFAFVFIALWIAAGAFLVRAVLERRA